MADITTLEELAERTREHAPEFEDLEDAIDYNASLLTGAEQLSVLRNKLKLMRKTVPGTESNLAQFVEDVIRVELTKMLSKTEGDNPTQEV